MIRKQFEQNKRYICQNDTTKHPLFDDSGALPVSEMLRRSVYGIPLSVPKPKENLPLNGNFFTDKFDVLDTAIRNDMRLSEERKQKQMEERKKQVEEVAEFKRWKEEQERARMLGNDKNVVVDNKAQ